LVELKVSEDPSLHVRLKALVIKPKFADNRQLEVDTDILYLVSFVCRKVISDRLSLDIVEFANLIQGIPRHLLKLLTVLPGGHQCQLIVEISDEVKPDAESIRNFSVL